MKLYPIQMLTRAAKLAAVAVVCLSSFGCAGTFEQPDKPAQLAPPENFYSEVDYKSDLARYDSDVDTGSDDSLQKAKLKRNKMITLIAADIDYNYGQYKGRVHVGRAEIATVGDAASLGLTAAITVVGGTALKSILGAADTALKGTMQSYDNHFYDQKATEIIVNSMDAIRTTQETLILKKLDLPVVAYPFGEARMDLVKLFFLGTREAGLAALEADAGKKSATANAAAIDAAEEKIAANEIFHGKATDDDVTMAKAIRQKIDTIAAGGPDALSEGVAILKRAKVTPTDASDLSKVTADLNLLADKADDLSQLKTVYGYFYP